MQIENRLPQFKNEKGLIIVAGEKAAKFYYASNGNIDELDLVKTPFVRYTDREGLQKKGSGANQITGSMYEQHSFYEHKNFLHALRNEVIFVHERNKFNSIYLFSPIQILEDVLRSVPKEFSSMVQLKIAGNFVDEHPFDLLLQIKKELEKNIGDKEPVKKDARKLLENKMMD